MLAYGEAKRGKHGAEMIHPEYRVQGDMSTPDLQETLTPVYPTTEGIKQATLRKLTDRALELLETCAIAELLPPELAQGMMSLPDALRTLHRPPPSLQLSELESGKHPAQRRLIWKSCWRITSACWRCGQAPSATTPSRSALTTR